MEYNDNLFPTPEDYEKMAKAYNLSLKNQGFVFIKLNDENYAFLIDEVFDLLFKLRSMYKYLGSFMGADSCYKINEQQIENLRLLFNFNKNRLFQIRTNKTKCFLNCISCENLLNIKLSELAQKSGHIEELSKMIQERMLNLYENLKVEGVFFNLTNLSFN